MRQSQFSLASASVLLAISTLEGLNKIPELPGPVSADIIFHSDPGRSRPPGGTSADPNGVE